MAVSSIALDIRANTEKALGEFKRFSAQLDNKFLVSGLKLDVVRSALGQINREFQKAIGEQGLQAGQSLRAAQNQVALLTQTFKGFSASASLDMATQFSTAFNEIAVKAGGTAQDIQKALAATPFISTNLSGDMRKALGEGVLSFQKDFRRAGLGEDFGGIARQFLMGQLSAEQMINSGDAGQSFLGSQLARSTGTTGLITNAQQRSEALLKIVQDPAFNKQLTDMAKRAYGFRGIIEDLSTKLFNPEKGIFGSLRQVTMSIKDKTTIFDETEKLINSVFGRQGLFVNFFKQIGKIFGIEDPLKVIIIGIRFVTRQFDKLNAFVQSPEIQGIVKKIQEAFGIVKDFAKSVYDGVTKNFGNTVDIQASVKNAGERIREFIESIGKTIREADVNKQGTAFLNTFTTVVGEVAQTLGTAIKEAILTVFSRGPAILGGAVKVLYEGFSKFFTGLFGGNQGAGAGFGGAAMVALGVLFVRRMRGAIESILAPIDSLRRGGGGGAGGFINRLLGGGRGDRNLEGGRMGFQAQVIARMDNIIRILGGYAGPSSPLEEGNMDPRRGGGGRGGRRRGPSGPRGPRIRPGTQYSSPIGPLAVGSSEPWTWADDTYQPYRDPNRTDANGRTVRQRFNRRYGIGGRLGRGMRGFGKGALIAGGAVAGLSLLGAGAANASEVEGGQGMGAGAAWGSVGMGAAQGAMTGAMFGPWGAAIGGVLGAGVSLMDKQVRDSVVKSTGDFANGALKKLQGLGTWLYTGIQQAFGSIKNFTSNIDWKNLILDVIFPGRGIARAVAEASGVKASGQNQGGFMGKVMDFAASIFGIREVGGPVIRGQSYIVGERGPEIFTPGSSGTISSNRELRSFSPGSGSSVSANFNISINVNSNMGAGDVESLRAPVLAIIQDAWNEVTYATVTRGAS